MAMELFLVNSTKDGHSRTLLGYTDNQNGYINHDSNGWKLSNDDDQERMKSLSQAAVVIGECCRLNVSFRSFLLPFFRKAISLLSQVG